MSRKSRRPEQPDGQQAGRYIKTKIREIYPDADFHHDLFLILQCMIDTEEEMVKARRKEEEYEYLNCLVYTELKKLQNNRAWKGIYPVPAYPYQNRYRAIAGLRYDSRIKPKHCDDYESYFLMIEQRREVSDLGIAIRFRDYEALNQIRGITVIWDYFGYPTVTMHHNLHFAKPTNEEYNCYVLQSIVQPGWTEHRPLRSGQDYSFVKEQPYNGQPHHIFWQEQQLSAESMDKIPQVVSQSRKFHSWYQQQEENDEE